MRSYIRYLGICAALILAWIPAAQGAERNVDWMNRVNVTVSGDTLQKTSGCNGCSDAGAVSRQAIWRNGGYVEFSPGETNTFWFAGLSRDDTGTAFDDIEFAFRFNGAGQADVMENGVYQNGGDTPYTAGDRFRVAVVNGRVQYLKNGRVLLESRKTPQFPLMLDVALGSVGTTVRRATIDVIGIETEEGADFRDFEALDTNRDGRIEWYEWRGSRSSFDAQDLNRDGVLTWGEFPSFGKAPISRTITLDSRERWVDTGMWVSEGDAVRITASGIVQLSTNPDDLAAPAGSRTNRRAPNAPLGDQPAGALIARIGNSAPMLIGAERSLLAPTSGPLLITVNDDHVADNTGSYRVDISVTRR
jgi:hypothetical protein